MLKWSIEDLLDQELSYTEPWWIGNRPDEMDSGMDEQGGICITDVHHDAPLFLSFSLSVFMSRLCTFFTTERQPWKNGLPKSGTPWVTCSCGRTTCWKTRVYDANLERRLIQKLKTNLLKSQTKPSLHRFIVHCLFLFFLCRTALQQRWRLSALSWLIVCTELHLYSKKSGDHCKYLCSQDPVINKAYPVRWYVRALLQFPDLVSAPLVYKHFI